MDILETKRHLLRTMTPDDFPALCAILQDPEVMYAYEHAFSDAKTKDWLDRQMHRYDHDGFGLWAMIRKSDGEFIGQCGITMQECGNERVPEIGWLLRRDCWHQGHASEAAMACRAYAFERLASTKCSPSSATPTPPLSVWHSGSVWSRASPWSSTITASTCRTSSSPSENDRQQDGNEQFPSFLPNETQPMMNIIGI